MNIKNKKQILTIMIFVFLFSANIAFFVPQNVRAQVAVVTPVSDTISTGNSIWQKIGKALDSLWKKSGSVAFMRAFQSFSNQLAYKAATQIATGENGKPQWFTKLITDEARMAGEAAGAEFLDNLASGYGIDICQPPTSNLSVNLALSLKLGLKEASVASMKPRCSLDELQKKWGEFAVSLTNPLSIISLNDASLMDVLKTKGYDLSKFISTTTIISSKLTSDQRRQLQAELLKDTISFQNSDTNFVQDAIQASKDALKKGEEKASEDRKAGDAPKAQRSTITGSLIVPAELTKQELINIQQRNEDAAKLRTEDIVVDSANIFLNTLVSKGLNRLIQSLMKEKTPQDNLAGSFGDSKTSIIDEIFSTINRISININPRDINLISEMEMDMGDEFMGKMNNKTIDSRFADVLRRAETEPLSTKEAIDETLLDGNKFFGYIDIGTSIRQPMLDEGYSYDNIKKLRKNRVVPVGWEFAALKIAQLSSDDYPAGCDSRGCKLVSVMDGYDKTGTFKRGSETIKDNYCGYRSVSLAPYNVNITSKVNCTAGMIGVDASTVDIKWINPDGAGNSEGYCIKYIINNEGIVSSKELETESSLNNETACNDSFGDDFYHEWIYGGCVVKEEDESPFCRLVDPNWVLKAPKQQCASEGYYSALESPESSNRYKDCADVKNCLKEDDNGNCLGYGYCLKEKNIWKFRGRKCDEKSAGCVSLKDDAGKEKSYILDTLKSCPQDEAGCKEYSKYKIKDIEGNYVWATTGFNYFNKNVSSCDGGNEGCSKFVEIVPGLNLVPNPSFEIDENEDAIPDGWIFDDGDITSTSTEAFDGRYSILHTKGESILKLDISNSDFNILDKGLYTLSYRVKKLTSDAVVSVTPILILNKGSISNTDANYSEGGSEWEMKSGYFGVDGNSSGARIEFAISGDVYIDAVQFELNNYDASNISSGVGEPSMYNNYGEKGVLHMKKAPSYYNCDLTNSDENCAKYSKYCSKDDVGCEAYKPENGDQSVSGIVSQEDVCPSECNNYQTFSQYPSYFEKLESSSDVIGLTDVNFISDSAKNCSPSQESCELFTNVDKANKGGEAREYYSYLRQCVKPSAVSSTIYYTWEGSDTSGFQLKTWRFLKSDKGNAPCTNVEIGATNMCSDIGLADAQGDGQCDPSTNLDCRTFYDRNAEPHKRLLSKTIPVTDDCIDLRREASTGARVVYRAVPSMSTKCSATSVGCRRYKGNNGNNIRNVLFEDFESGSSNDWEVSNALYKTISKESTVYNGHSMVVYSDEEATVNLEYNLTENGEALIPGKRYTLDFWVKNSNEDKPSSGDESIPKINYNDLNPLKLFKASAQGDPINNIDFGPVELRDSKEWLQYKYNWQDVETSVNGDYILKFSIKLPSNYKTFFIDNISLKEITNDFYKIKDSWVTPATCSGYLGCQKYSDRDNNPWYFYQFTNTCNEENVGCSAMIDTQNSEMPFQQTYNAYCQDNAGGECSRGRTYYKNYSDINSGNYTSSTAVVAKDKLVYLIKERKNLCASSNKGCSAFGFKGDDGQYQDVYKINNPDNYIQDDYFGFSNKILCLSEFKDCSAFSISGGGTIYKIHPRDKVCQYFEADMTMNRSAGYYSVNDPSLSCDGNIYNENYNLLLSDMNYANDNISPFGSYNNNYSVSCDSNQSKCSMFIDPTDAKDLSIEATNVTNQQIDFTNSNSWGLANWQDGQFENISNLSASETDDTLSFAVSNKNAIIYKASKNSPFAFSVGENAVYRLSANVEFDGVTTAGKEYISTFLSCGPRAKDGTMSYIEDNVSDEANDPKGGSASGLTPYAFPFAKSNYFIQELDNKSHQISGLYKILPGANYCNVAFYVGGKSGSVIKLKAIKFEKMEGNYYYIDNEELDKTSCNKANFKEGCVLFNNLSKSNLSYNASRSYESGSLVGIDANDSSYNNDSNELLKVIRDRECAEWDTCSSKIKTVDAQGQDKYSCVSLIGCDKLSSSGDCANYVPKNKNDKALNLEKYYSSIGTGSWSDFSYSGYSMPGAYAPHSLSAYKTTSSSVSTYKLGHIIKRGQYSYKDGISYANPLSSTADILDVINIASPKSCRLYPSKDSPFSWTPNNNMVLNYELSGSGSKYAIITGKDSAFANANISQPSYGALKPGEPNVLTQGQSSDCSYTSVSYGTETIFYPYDGISIPDKIEISSDYGTTTTTMKMKKIAKNMGWLGFCLDYDKSRFINTNYINSHNDPNQFNYRCLSWYPVDLVGGEVDLASFAPEASVNNDIPDNAKLCAVSEDFVTENERIYCGEYALDNTCNYLIVVPAGSRINKNYLANNPTQNVINLIYGNNGNSSDPTWLTSSYVTQMVPSRNIMQILGVPAIVKTPTSSVEIDENNHETTPPETYKFTKEDFGNYTANRTIINNLFVAPNSLYGVNLMISKYKFDEIDSDEYIHIGDTVNRGTQCGSDNADWSEAASCFSDGYHELKHEYYFVGDGCNGQLQGTYHYLRYCNPLQYNYYIQMDSQPSATCGTGDNPCLQTCNSYINLKNATLNANNVYLNSIPLTDIGGTACLINGIDICATVRSSDLTNYNINTSIRYSEIRNGANFIPITAPFSVFLGDSEGRTPAARFSNKSSFDFYANTNNGENINKAKINLSNVIESISTQYIKVYSNGSWNSSSYIWDNNSGPLPINIKSVVFDKDGKTQTMGDDGFSINGVFKSSNVSFTGSQNIDLSFYSYASPASTPIMEIKICWSGSEDDCSIFTGPFKNRKSKCERQCGTRYTNAFSKDNPNICSSNTDCVAGEKCFAKTWGDTEKACIDDVGNEKAYSTFSNVYVCSPMSDTWSNDCGDGRGCCQYKPKITVTDNWGKSKSMFMCGVNNNCMIKIYPQ